MEGPLGGGRRTAVAAAAQAGGRPVVALELCRVADEAGALEAAIVALRRECLLRDALPLIVDADASGVAEGGGNALAQRRRILRDLSSRIDAPRG